MFKILEKRFLSSNTELMVIDAPSIARRARPGQFIILRIDEFGERIPLTIADYDAGKGRVTIIYQRIGATTEKLGTLQAGDYILDFVGPLGVPSHLDGFGRVAVIGGGLGCAIAYPQAKYLFEHGTEVDIIAGFRNTDFIILEDEMRASSNRLVLMTDDGSNGNKGLVTDGLRSLIESGVKYDLVIVIGPPIMMKFVCKLTAEFGIKTVVSMNPIMIDGTGMCGCCRITVAGKTKFACVDGPDFDGHEVDFDELIARNKSYMAGEKQSLEAFHKRDENCNLMKAGDKNG